MCGFSLVKIVDPTVCGCRNTPCFCGRSFIPLTLTNRGVRLPHVLTARTMRVADFPASNWIRFLSAYGPDTSNTNLFDERVGKSARRYKIAPFVLDTAYVPQIVTALKADSTTSILIAGVAGDGKSFHLRRVWEELSQQGPETWEKDGDITITVEKENGGTRQVTFIKDLSANLTAFGVLLDKIERSNETDEAFVIACNHGQILARLRAVGRDALAAELEDVFFQQNAVSCVGNFRVFDLSRTSQAENLKEIIRQVAEHPQWKNCVQKQCPHCESCPIRRNRELLWDTETGKPTVATERLCRLVEAVGYNGQHVPIRELFVLVINALLGYTGGRATGSCHDVSHLVSELRTHEMDVYTNLLGYNVSANVRAKSAVFRSLGEFQIGSRGNAFFDELIVLGREHPKAEMREIYNRYFGLEELVAKSADEKVRSKQLAQARRKLFFSWQEPETQQKGLEWSLTTFNHIDGFLALRRNIEEGDTSLPGVLLEGFARMLTGSTLSKPQDGLKVSTNGASSKVPVGLLVAGKFYPDHDEVMLELSGTGADAVPEVCFCPSRNETIRFALTPRRYEFLTSLAEGYVSTSFSGQCLAEFFSLKARLVKALEKKRKNYPQHILLEFTDGKTVKVKVAPLKLSLA